MLEFTGSTAKDAKEPQLLQKVQIGLDAQLRHTFRLSTLCGRIVTQQPDSMTQESVSPGQALLEEMFSLHPLRLCGDIGIAIPATGVRP